MAGITRSECAAIMRLSYAYGQARADESETRNSRVRTLMGEGRDLAQLLEDEFIVAAENDSERARQALETYLTALLLPGTAAQDQAQHNDQGEQQPVHEPLPVAPGLA